MSHDNSNLIKENIALKEKLDKVEGQNAELTKQNGELTMHNQELADKNAKLLEEIEAMKAEKLQQNNSTHSTDSNPSLQQILEEKSNDSAEVKIDGKRAKFTGRRVQNWLIDSLEWIPRKEMADSKLSTSCKTFNQLCWPKLHEKNVKPHKVACLYFRGDRNESTGIYRGRLEKYVESIDDEIEIPIACVPPPDYIIGFKGISIDFLNGRVMKFIECIYSKLNGIAPNFGTFHHVKISIYHSLEQFGQIRRLFEMMAKKAISFYDDHLFDFMRFHPNAFGLIENVQSITGISSDKPEMADLLVKWLNKSRTDKKPKLLEFYQGQGESIGSIIDQIKEQFIASTQSANFFVAFEGPNYPIFNLENGQTGEVLALYPNADADGWTNFEFLVRHPKGEERLRADWEKQFK